MGRDDEPLRQAQLLSRQRRLRALEAEATKGLKLHKTPDRIWAALELTRAWREANTRGLGKAQFEAEVLENLTRSHARRTEFRLSRYTLTRREAERMTAAGITPADTAAYKDLHEPQKSLDAYLAGLRVAARHCGADPDDWAADMLAQTSLWKRPVLVGSDTSSKGDEEADQADIPAETLAILLQQMARHLARTNGLGKVMAEVVATPSRWSMFEERLRPSSNHCMQRAFAMSPPAGGAVYFEEMPPFPSVPLVRVPLLTRPATVGLMPNGPLSVGDLSEDEALAAYMFATGISPTDTRLPVLGLPPEDQIERMEGQIILFREVRLALAPIDRHGWGAVLEFRPALVVELPEGEGERMCYWVANAVEPDLARPHFYPQQEEGRLVWPTIERHSGVHRVACLDAHDEVLDRFGSLQALWAEGLLAPVETPFGPPEPWYLTYAALDAAEVRRWLAPDAPFSEDAFSQPWSPLAHAPEVYGRDLPPERELIFSGDAPAASVERCLHNGLIEGALQAIIDGLAGDLTTLRLELSAAREGHAQRLLNRWHGATP